MLVTAVTSSLPVVSSLSQCADYSRTVSPYLHQVQPFFLQLWDNIASTDRLKSLYLSTNPLVIAFALSLFLAPVFLLVSEINKNYSQVDRVWSILPALYISHYTLWAHIHGLNSARLDNVMAIAITWGLRLTFNYWRKGGYQIGSEDYRWAIVKDYVGPGIMFVLNVVFISLVQSLLLFVITTPAYVLLLASQFTGEGMNFTDICFSRGIMGLILVEFFADQQQWNFHKAKKTYQETAKVPEKFTREDLDLGFNTTGLWSLSRHPNFAAEQAIWVALYQWGCFATDTFINWTFVGAIAYLALFQASTWLTELLTSRKYKDYKEYQNNVNKFIPKISAFFG